MLRRSLAFLVSVGLLLLIGQRRWPISAKETRKACLPDIIHTMPFPNFLNTSARPRMFSVADCECLKRATSPANRSSHSHSNSEFHQSAAPPQARLPLEPRSSLLRDAAVRVPQYAGSMWPAAGGDIRFQ